MKKKSFDIKNVTKNVQRLVTYSNANHNGREPVVNSLSHAGYHLDLYQYKKLIIAKGKILDWLSLDKLARQHFIDTLVKKKDF